MSKKCKKIRILSGMPPLQNKRDKCEDKFDTLLIWPSEKKNVKRAFLKEKGFQLRSFIINMRMK